MKSITRHIGGRCLAEAFISCAVFLALVSAVDASENRRTPIVTAVEKTLPSVVNIGTERMVKVRYSDPFRRFRGNLIDQFFSQYFGPPPMPGYKIGHSLGSGVIVHKDGYILTNYHVIERASRILVTLSDERAYQATAIAGDEVSDLALIRIYPEEPLQAIDFGIDDDLLLGESVIVLGNPFGLTHTVTVGVLSAKDRPATYGGEILYRDILQTDAAVNPGSSGGPLLNLDGELIGVNVAIYQDAQNIGFAIPVKRVRQLLAQWLSPRILRKIWLGVGVDEVEGALMVSEVFDESPASDVDIQVGDRIVAVDDRVVHGLYQYNSLLMEQDIGDIVELALDRAGVRQEVRLEMDVVPKPSGPKLALRHLGLKLEEPEKTSRFRKGLLITEVTEGGPAAALGLKAGLWVTRIDRFEVQSLDDVGTALEGVRSGHSVPLVVVSVDERDSFIVAQSSTVQLVAE